MFQPASLKGQSPTPLDESLRKRYLPIYLTIILLSFIPVSLFEYWFITLFWQNSLVWLFFLLLPFNVVIATYILQMSASVISALLLNLVNLIYRPKEGVFSRDIKDKDYRFWNLRNIIKKWPLYVAASHPFPWLKNRFVMRFFGVKIGKKCMCDNAWLSSEFLRIGDNVILGMASNLLSFGIEQDKFILASIILEDNTQIGAKCVLMPGTTIKKGAKLSAHSYTRPYAILESNSIYKGHPAEKISK